MTYRLLIPLLALALLIPGGAFAATKASCTLTVYTPRGEVSFSKKGDVLVKVGEQVTIAWASKNATRALDREGDPIAVQGSERVIPEKIATYTYKFYRGSKRVECAARLVVATASIDPASLSTDQAKPTLKGDALGTKTVRIAVEDNEGDRVYTSKDIKVKKGKWSAKSTKSLDPGTYEVTIFGAKDLKLNAIATTTLTVFTKGSATGGSLSVSPIPLLMGGNAAPGTVVPVAYIKVSNTGKTATSIQGFTLVQNGTAPTDVVIGFTTNDDKGGSRTTIGGTEGSKQFRNGVANVPLAATIEAGQFRIFTIKAILSRASGSSAGKNLKLDVSGVDTKASVRGAFPIRGTTLTLTY